MRMPGSTAAPLSALTAAQKLALGSALTVVGAAVMVLSPHLGWTGFARPWSFLIGFAGGLTGGVGVALAVCGLLRGGRHALRSNPGTHRNSDGRS